MFDPKLVVSTFLKHVIQMDDQRFTPEELVFREEFKNVDQTWEEDNLTHMEFTSGSHELLIKLDREANKWVVIYTYGEVEQYDNVHELIGKFNIEHSTSIVHWMDEDGALYLMTIIFYPIIKHFMDSIGIEI